MVALNATTTTTTTPKHVKKKFKGGHWPYSKVFGSILYLNCEVHDLFTHLLQNKSDNTHVLIVFSTLRVSKERIFP